MDRFKIKLFTGFVMLLVTADALYIYFNYGEFNALYAPSVIVLGSIVFLLSKTSGKKE